MSTLTDVTAEPGAADKAQRPALLWHGLKSLGFESVGQMKSEGGNLTMYNHILVDRDRQTFALPEQDPRGDEEIIYFRSVLEDGTSLDTARAPLVSPLLVVPPRISVPSAGYTVQRFPGLGVEDLYREHKSTLDRLCTERNSPVVTADAVPTYLVLARHRGAMSRWGMVVQMSVVFAMVVPLVLYVVGSGADIGENQRLRWAMGMGAMVAWQLSTMVAGRLIPRLPFGPRRRTFAAQRGKHG